MRSVRCTALPPLPPYVAEHYQGQPEYAKFVETFAGLKMKCDTCHTPGADKKAKGHGLNDFGKAVHDNFKHKDFLAANKAKESGLRTVDVAVAGPGAGRESAVRALSTAGLDVRVIRDRTPIPHNGCRAPKRRRV